MLPNDPPDQNNNPPDLNNPYAPQPPLPPNHPDFLTDPAQSEVAKHQKRDEHGRFIPDQPNPNQNPIPPSPQPPPAQTAPNPSVPPNPSNPPNSSAKSDSSSSMPPPISITENTKYSEKKDPPMLNIFFTNPVTYFRKWVDKLIKNQDIDLRLKIKPFATAGLILTFTVVGGGAFTIGRYFFPYSSPIFHRQVVYPGIIQKGESGGYVLQTSDSVMWKLKSKHNNINLSNLDGKAVVITGNLTTENYLIEVSEVIVADSPSQPAPPIPSPTLPNSPLPDEVLTKSGNPSTLPSLYSGLQWDITQSKILTFTSGKRRIEQEGVYLESSLVTDYPQGFIDYYTNQLLALSFKQTLNSSQPSGNTITYSKDDLFLTFGVKNVYSGSGDNKKLTGYTAYIEHN
ncbi:MAG: Uncharacterized protein G01um10147_132 [Microgenomates group bacterium Gr01-1014_7]|nr:MAG: Uncharacterized protein G01um10147_132 [Microgenomates group bacterium Gr01-1014_7]